MTATSTNGAHPYGCALERVCISYAGQPALGPLDLQVPTGQAVALVGPSGAGKTSLLRAVAGQLRPGSGRVLLAGRDISGLRSAELPGLAGLMSQRLDLIPQLSVRHNVQSGALGRWGLARSLAALLLPLEHPPARAAARRVGLEQLLPRRVADLSGGELQRVALARLLVQDPAVVLADEPVASLDPARADDLLGMMRATGREGGRTLIVSLHSPELAVRHFDRVIGLRAGRIVFDLPPSRVTPAELQSLYELLDLTPTRP